MNELKNKTLNVVKGPVKTILKKDKRFIWSEEKLEHKKQFLKTYKWGTAV